MSKKPRTPPDDRTPSDAKRRAAPTPDAVATTSERAPDGASTTANGGASGNEDSTRAAGYVTDATQPPASPPGPAVEHDPAQFVGPLGDAPPPRPRPTSPGTADVPPRPAAPGRRAAGRAGRRASKRAGPGPTPPNTADGGSGF